MSQASKHVQWCLNKAKKEIKECEEQGKREKHRGLLRTESDVETAKQHIEKAVHNFEAVQLLEKQGFPDWSISATFYTIYHCFLAIAAKFGYESRNQTCTISLMEWLKEEGKIDIEEKYLNLLKYTDDEDSVIDLREEFTYGIRTTPDEQGKMKELIDDCRKIIDATKEIVYQ